MAGGERKKIPRSCATICLLQSASGLSEAPEQRSIYLRTANLSFADDDRGLSRFSWAEGRITSSAIET
jgi:hypothetical protein